jgi:hypothetical protein
MPGVSFVLCRLAPAWTPVDFHGMTSSLFTSTAISLESGAVVPWLCPGDGERGA